MEIRREENLKKKVGILGVILVFFSLLFINAPPVYAVNATQLQVDVGEFNVWLHSDGVTWQNIPGYGVKKPGDTVTITYTISYDGPVTDKVVGVKGASFYTGDQGIYNTTYRKTWQEYKIYEEKFNPFCVTNITNIRAVYKGNRQVQMTVTIDLKTAEKHGNPLNWGKQIKEPWMATLTDGRKFYIPTLIEWEIEATGYNLTVQIEGQGSTTPAGSKAPGTIHKNMSGNVPLAAVPADGWKFAQWVDVTAGIVQFSTTPNSTVNMDKNKTIRAVFIPDNTPPPGKQEYLTVVPSQYTLFEGEYKRFKAFHHKADGTSPEVTNSCEWSVTNSSIASLSATTKGELWGRKEGQVELKARYQGMEGTSNVTVIPEPVPPPPNYKPKAYFTIGNPSPVEGEQVHFYDESTHEGNKYGESIVSWEWTFEKAGSASEPNPETSWGEVGTYKVTLRVEDQDGDSDSCSKSVVVGPAIPAAVITTSANYIIIGREIHIDGDESTAAMGRDIKWDEMEWKFYNPSNSLTYEYTGRYPLGKGTSGEKDLTNSVLNKTGNWRVTLKVKDTNDNESEVTERIIQVYPDNPPIADFWLASEAIRYSYEGYDLTVRDLSTSGNPDGSLGDEIYERTWTLYYDANNDGNAKGSGDEIIRPGDTGKAAQIIQATNNDPRPVIRFYKTGRYLLELTVKERYEAWGEVNEGLSADTDGKAVEEKQLIVINLAPTVAFDIKKKTPADILFAADYTVSDSKYNSLNSGQPAFINELESGFVEPEVGVDRVTNGEVIKLFSTKLPASESAWVKGPYVSNIFPAIDDGSYNIGIGWEQFSTIFYPYNINSGGTLNSGHLSALPTPNKYIYWSQDIWYGKEPINLQGVTANDRFSIKATKGSLSIYSGSTLIDSVIVPRSNIKSVFGSNYYDQDGPFFIGPWGNKTIILFWNMLFTNQDNFTDYVYVYLVDNNSGQIINHSPIATSGWLPQYIQKSYWSLGIMLHQTELLDSSIGLIFKTEEPASRCWYYRCSILSPSYQKIFIQDATQCQNEVRVYFVPLNANLFEFVNVDNEGTDIHYLYNHNGGLTKIIPTYPKQWEWYIGHSEIDTTPFRTVFLDGSFAYTIQGNNNKDITYYYSSSGSLKWQIEISRNNIYKPFHVARNKIKASYPVKFWYSFSVNESIKYSKYIVITDTWGPHFSSDSTLLVNAETGIIEHLLPYAYGGNDAKQLFLITQLGKDSYLFSYGQLQGLQYLKQAIEKHTWDANKFNVVASVIDGDSFTDFEAQKDSITSLLQAKNLKLAVISPATGSTKAQTEELISVNPDGGWWVQTASTMPTPLSDLAKKIIQAVNEDRGADNIVLVGQEAELKANYNDMEGDPADRMEWAFTHDNINLGNSFALVNPVAISTLHNTKQTVSLDSNNQNQLNIAFDQAGTYLVHCQAQDLPVTTDDYLDHEKAGKQWSNQDAYITVIAHRKPIASFTINSSSINKNNPLNITDNSYDPDLYNLVTKATTDPLNQKGLRAWEWQFKKPGGVWEKHLTNDNIPPTIYAVSGTYELRLRVQDVFGAWSDWTASKAFNVVNRPPIANFTVDPNPASLGYSSMIIDSSYDLDGDEIVEWIWEIEKGLGQNEIINRSSPIPFPYVWNMEGTFNVKLTVKDIEGATGTITKPVTVILNHPPVAIIKLPAEIFTDEWFTADGTSSYDPDGDLIAKAYWQYMKPGDINWSETHTQVRGGSFSIAGESFLRYPLYPKDGEHGTWKLRLIVEDDKNLISLPAEISFTVTEGWEIIGNIVPEIGERNRKMIVAAYAHRKGKPDEKYMIDSMQAELAWMDYECTINGRAVAEGRLETLNMPYDNAKADFRVTYLIKDKIYEDNRWPADGRYYIKVIGQKGSTTKEIVLPFSIKGNLYQRIYIRTYSW